METYYFKKIDLQGNILDIFKIRCTCPYPDTIKYHSMEEVEKLLISKEEYLEIQNQLYPEEELIAA